MRAYHTTGSEPKIKIVDDPEPELSPRAAIVDVHAASLNYRDLLNLDTDVPFVPLSDAAGVVRAIGDAVTHVRVGDRVAIGFMPGWLNGPLDAAKQASALGAVDHDGVLRERLSVPASALVPIPDDMSFAEASTLPCAWRDCVGGALRTTTAAARRNRTAARHGRGLNLRATVRKNCWRTRDHHFEFGCQAGTCACTRRRRND